MRAAVFYPKPICRMERIPVCEFLSAFCLRGSVAVLDTTKCVDVKLYQRFSRQWAGSSNRGRHEFSQCKKVLRFARSDNGSNGLFIANEVRDLELTEPRPGDANARGKGC